MRSALAHIILLMLCVSAALGDERQPDLIGLWRGSYVCGQGITGLTLAVIDQQGADFAGFFHFYPTPQNGVAKEGCFTIEGKVAADRSVKIVSGRWITRPPGYSTVGLYGHLIDSGLAITGQVVEPGAILKSCRAFELNRQAQQAITPAACRNLQSTLQARAVNARMTSRSVSAANSSAYL